MKYRSRIAIVLVVVIFLMTTARTLAGIPRTGSCEELKNADELWWAGQFHETHELYVEVAGSENHTLLDRVGAMQRLALQARLKYENADSALSLLNRAVQLGEASAFSFAMMSRFVLEEGLTDSAMILAKYSLAESQKLSDSLQAVLALGWAVLEFGEEAYLTGNSIDTMILRDAAQKLNAAGQLVPSEIDFWDCLLGVSLLLRDGPLAMHAWKQYLEMGPEDSLFNLAGGSIYDLPELLSSWNGNDLDDKSRRVLLKALSASRMFDYVILVATSPGLSDGAELARDPEIADILDYTELVTQARSLINHIYRKRLMGDSTIAADIQEFLGLAYNYWQSLDYPGERPEFSTDEIGAQLSRRWGAIFCSVDFSPESFDMTWGHEVRTEIRELDQYEHRIDIKFIDLDQMVSTGMMAWITDGDVQIGGWTPTPEAVYRIRPAWNRSGTRTWESLTSPEKRKQIQDRISSLRMTDDSLANADPYSNLPGADLRLQYATQQRLHDSMLSIGYTGKVLRRAFIDEYQRLKFESSIVAHEGRHAIDMAFYGEEFETWDAARVEMSGKLSEILFSPDPWFTVGNSSAVFYAGDTTSGHGAASRLMRKQLVDWMDEHSDKIDGFDHSRATLPQLDLLTTEQLLAALRELDPLAKAGQ